MSDYSLSNLQLSLQPNFSATLMAAIMTILSGRNREVRFPVTNCSMFLSSLVCAVLLVSPARTLARENYSFAVEVKGHGQPMILIPGLACGGEVWKSTVDHYMSHYQCHVLTLPGFAGQPAIDAPILPKVRNEIIAYISNKNLNHPVIIGHSLGGFMALWIAAVAPQTVGKVVSVDGPACLPALMNPSADLKTAAEQAASLRDTMAHSSKAAFEAGEKRSLTMMITAPEDIQWVLKTSALSDPKSVGESMYELYTTDLRPIMHSITTPVLMLAEAAFFTTDSSRASAMESYEAQIHAIPHHTLKMSPKARHFIMLDDPTFYFNEIDSFLGS
jgi:pimeloyl-ACP methyl ester carboxylesterase